MTSTIKRTTVTATVDPRADAIRWHDRYRFVRRAVTVVQGVRAGLADAPEGQRAVLVGDAARTAAARLLDCYPALLHAAYSPGMARTLIAGRIEYAASTFADADALDDAAPDGASREAEHLSDLAAANVAQAVHVLSGCYGRCCGHSVPDLLAVCRVPAVTR